MLSAAQVFVNSHGCAFAVSNTVDNESRSEHAIAACKNSGRGRHQSLGIHSDQSARRNLNLVFGSEEVETRCLADGHDDGVALDLTFAVLVKRRTEAAILIEDPLRLQRLESDHPAVFADDTLRSEAGINNDSLFLCLFDLFESSGHLVAAFEAYEVHLPRAH